MCPLSGENYCIYATLVFVTLFRWRLVCWLNWIQPVDQTPPKQSDKYQYPIDTVIFFWWWAHGCPKPVEKRNKYIKQNCAPNWIFCKIIQGYTFYKTWSTPISGSNIETTLYMNLGHRKSAVLCSQHDTIENTPCTRHITV